MKPNVDLIVLFFLCWNIIRFLFDKPWWVFAVRTFVISLNLVFFYYPIDRLKFTLLFVLSVLIVPATIDYNKPLMKKGYIIPTIVDIVYVMSFFVLMVLSAAGLLTSGSVTLK